VARGKQLGHLGMSLSPLQPQLDLHLKVDVQGQGSWKDGLQGLSLSSCWARVRKPCTWTTARNHTR
jgi:hypothetical protein